MSRLLFLTVGRAGLILEGFLQRNLKAWQQRSRHVISRRRGEQGPAPQAFARPFPDLGRIPARIEDPVLPYPELFVGFELEDLVQSAGIVRQDLDDQVGRSPDVRLREDRLPLVGDEEEIGLNDVVR